MHRVHSGTKSAAKKISNHDTQNRTGLYTSNAANDIQIGSRFEVPIMREQPDTEFFRLFDLADAPKSTTADNFGSSLRVLQGAASAVFGGIMSAVDTAFAILNEDVEYADEVSTRNADDGHEYDSAILSSCESVQIDDGENLAFVASSLSPSSSVQSKGKIEMAPSLTNSEAKKEELSFSTLDSVEVSKSSTQYPVVTRCNFSKLKLFLLDKRNGNNSSNEEESDYYIIHNESHKIETNDGWLVVSND